MKLPWILLISLLVCCTGTSCKQPANELKPPAVDPPDGGGQPKLPVIKLWLGNEVLLAEIARTPEQLSNGMMFRKNLAENEAMLFVFPSPHQASFWMKNTSVPLSCAFIDPDGRILEIRPLEPLNEVPVISNHPNVQFVLETRQGWFERHSIAPGTLIRTERGPLAETFLGRR